MRSLDFVLNHNFFKHDAIHYKQIFGCAMGSPIRPVIADLVMEEIEESAIATALQPPKWWFRYIDDSHTCLTKDQVDEFHQHLNSIKPFHTVHARTWGYQETGTAFSRHYHHKEGYAVWSECLQKAKPHIPLSRFPFSQPHVLYVICRQYLATHGTKHTINTKGNARKRSESRLYCETIIIPLPSSKAVKDRCRNSLPIYRPMALWCYPMWCKDWSNLKAATNPSRLQTIENCEQFVPATESPGKVWPATIWYSVQNQLHQLQFLYYGQSE